MEMTTRTRTGLKSLAAVMGGAALVVLGLAAVAQDETSPAAVTASTMTMGQTTTETAQHVSLTPSTVVVVPAAAPVLKAPRPKGF
ncbi:hypothetical protein JCM12141A_57500 [Mycolicibacterium hodleri]